MRGFLMILIFGFMVFSVYYIAEHDKNLLGPKIVQIINVVKEKIGIQKPQDQDIYCALRSIIPEPGSHVKAPVNISLLIDNTNTDCAPWVVFEGQAGTVSLYNIENNKLLDTGVLTTKSDWTTGFPVTYTAGLSNFVYSGQVKLVFTEENPSGQGNPKQSFITFFVD